MNVRPATLEDLPAVLAVERASETAPHWPESAYREIILGTSAVPRCLFVAESGFAVGRAVAGVAELESVAVAPGWQRRGLGRALCVAVIDWCRGQGAVEVELEVRASSAGAIALYRSLEFVECGSRRGYYADPQDDATLMRLPLQAACIPERIIEDHG